VAHVRIVQFHQRHADGISLTAHDRGVGTGDKTEKDGRISIVVRGETAGGDFILLFVAPIIVRSEQGPGTVAQFQGRILERARHSGCGQVRPDRADDDVLSVVPFTIKPAISGSSPVPTSPRVEMFTRRPDTGISTGSSGSIS